MKLCLWITFCLLPGALPAQVPEWYFDGSWSAPPGCEVYRSGQLLPTIPELDISGDALRIRCNGRYTDAICWGDSVAPPDYSGPCLPAPHPLTRFRLFSGYGLVLPRKAYHYRVVWPDSPDNNQSEERQPPRRDWEGRLR